MSSQVYDLLLRCINQVRALLATSGEEARWLCWPDYRTFEAAGRRGNPTVDSLAGSA